MKTVQARLERLESDGAIAIHSEGQDCESPVTCQAAVAEENLVARINELQKRTLTILQRAEATGRANVVAKLIREARSNTELIARLTGQFDRPNGESRITAVVMMPGRPDGASETSASETTMLGLEITRSCTEQGSTQ